MVELVNRFLVYLRDAKKIKSEEKLRAYYEFAYQFYMDFIPLEYPELKQSIANMDPEIVEYFIRYWLIDNDLVYSPEELQTAGLALRHFFKFLVVEERLTRKKANALQRKTMILDYDEIFAVPSELDDGVEAGEFWDGVFDDLDASVSKLEAYRKHRADSISANLKNLDTIPPFIILIKYFLECIKNSQFDGIDLSQGNFIINAKLDELLKKAEFLPNVDYYDFFRSLVWLSEEMGFIDIGKEHWSIRKEGTQILDLELKEIWKEILLGIEELFLLFPSLGLNTPLEQKKSGEFSVFIDVMRRLPTNMWVKLEAGYSLYSNNSLSTSAGLLDKLINYSENQPLKSICQACYWSGLLDVKIENNQAIRIIKTPLGSTFFSQIQPPEIDGY